MGSMIRWYKERAPALKFMIKCLSLIAVWKISYIYVIYPHTPINEWLTNAVGNTTTLTFQLFNHQSEFLDGRYLYIDHVRSVIIDHSCNGLELHALFLGFLILVSGRLSLKFVYAVVGVFIIFAANVIRVYLLGLDHIYSPEAFDFNHKYLYLGGVYLLIFGLWMLWLEVLSKKASA